MAREVRREYREGPLTRSAALESVVHRAPRAPRSGSVRPTGRRSTSHRWSTFWALLIVAGGVAAAMPTAAQPLPSASEGAGVEPAASAELERAMTDTRAESPEDSARRLGAQMQSGQGLLAPASGESAAGSSPLERPAAADDPGRGDLTSDVPPPSTWDQQRKARGEDISEPSEERSLIAQLGRTLLALLIVVGVIYALGKLAMTRLGNVRFAGRTGKTLQVIERLQLDAKHAVFLVQVGDDEAKTLLLASGEKGVQLLTEVDLSRSGASSGGGDAGPARTFKQLLTKAAAPAGPAPADSDERSASVAEGGS